MTGHAADERSESSGSPRGTLSLAVPAHPLRLLVVLPSWVGDAVMATPALRLLRDRLPGSMIGALARPGIDQVLAGSPLLDEVHTYRPEGVMASKRAAGLVRPRRYDAALLLTNSFSTALITRLAFIPRRVGYERDARGPLLTQRLAAPRRPDGDWAIVPAVDYYHHAAATLLDPTTPPLAAPPLERADRVALALPAGARLELAVTDTEHTAAPACLTHAGIGPDDRVAVLNPGGNNPAKRWPPDRFAALGEHFATAHGLRVLVSGAPSEAVLARQIAAEVRSGAVALPDHGLSLGALKGILARAAVLVTNDTGPRHVAAALGTPVVTLFGPTDARWTTIPTAREAILLADPSLPPEESANDHPDRCAIERLGLDRVIDAVDGVLRTA